MSFLLPRAATLRRARPCWPSSAPRRFRHTRPLLKRQEAERSERFAVLEAEAEASGLPLELRCATVLERWPSMLPEVQPYERDWHDLKQRERARRRQGPSRRSSRARRGGGGVGARAPISACGR